MIAALAVPLFTLSRQGAIRLNGPALAHFSVAVARISSASPSLRRLELNRSRLRSGRRVFTIPGPPRFRAKRGSVGWFGPLIERDAGPQLTPPIPLRGIGGDPEYAPEKRVGVPTLSRTARMRGVTEEGPQQCSMGARAVKTVYPLVY